MAQRFRFRLQKILAHRIAREKQEQIELVRRRAVVEREQQVLQELFDREQQILARMKPEVGDILDIQEREQCEYWLDQTMEEQEKQQRVVQQARDAVIEQQATVSKATQDVKVLEKLREKQKEEFRLEQLRLEQFFLDDVASQQFTRRRRLAEEQQGRDARRTTQREQDSADRPEVQA